MITPIERHDNVWIKRDDLFTIHGMSGAKSRTAFYLINKAKNEGFTGITTAGSRMSPQINIVANISRAMNMVCVAHCPQGELSPELVDAKNNNAIIIQHFPGYNTVIKDRCHQYSIQNKFYEIPFGMMCEEAIIQTSDQVKDIPNDIKRIVITVGSGMNLCGLLWGLKKANITIPILGVVVGANPLRVMNNFAPIDWQSNVTLVNAGMDYHRECKDNFKYNILFDPIYESRCLKFIQPFDLFWIIGVRKTLKK